MKISVSGLHKVYQDAGRELEVIKKLDFEFPESGTLAIMGRSGIGKSTLLHLIGGLDGVSAGSITYNGTDITQLGHNQLAAFRGRHIGFVFQFHHLLPEFNALENAAMPLLIQGESESKALKAAEEMLERVGLTDRATHRPSELSGGEQQRVALARAIVTSPEVILADEPTGNLDVETAREMQELLASINQELNNTLIMVTHSRELAHSLDLVLEMLPGGNLEERS